MSVLTFSSLLRYDATVVRRDCPERPGVYRLCYRASDDKYYVFYVGQAGDLRDRLLDHLQDSEPNGCIRQAVRTNECAFQYVIVSSQTDRDRIEREQIREYRPKCNDK